MFEASSAGCYNHSPARIQSAEGGSFFCTPPQAAREAASACESGQVAQLVERSPEKAGVGGSIPSLATINFNNLATAKKRVKISRANNTRTSVCLPFTFGAARSFPRRVAGPTNVVERESGHNLPHIERLRLDIRCRVTFQQSLARFTSRRRV